MQTFNMALLAEQIGFSGEVRVSSGVIRDTIFATESCVAKFGVRAVGRLEYLLEDTAQQLAQYPKGAQAVRLTHYRIPPSGNMGEPLALELEAIVVQGDPQHGDYLLIAQADELNHSTLLSAAA